ncbi:peptidoglycan DD-metalloendopeptidase family protein [Pseudoalteromonas piscicida]|uniref:Peptidase M23 n=1 Tax=Pseudoalteromonas piscicida TaxID=43662 RepID=A0A2A5JRT3_PSEO7|nr:M23 family metallopeptidase [Pseudoalteromonas piscicida]PCK32100.1 peptidase M23 [Pseudoalteromonas piscicida]
MLQVLKRLYVKLFKPTQLIVRQDATVKMLKLPSWVQACVLLIFVAVALWIANAVIQLQENTIKLNKEQQNLAQLQAKWQSEKAQLKATLAQQQSTLEQLSQQHTVLESLIDSTELQAQQSETNEQAATANNKTSQTNNGEFAPQANRLLIQQRTLSETLGQTYESEIVQMKASIDNAGLQLSDSAEAQGGPYFQADLALVEASFIKAIDQYTTYAQLSTMIGQVPDTLPVAQEKYYVSSAFGFRKDPITGRRAYHKGIDLAGWHKTQIIAPAAGVVKRAGKNGGYGNFIEIAHANDITTRFGHLHTIKVKKGQQINKGDVIALMGSTGRSTSTHLHYEVIQGKKHLNPIKIARAFNK